MTMPHDIRPALHSGTRVLIIFLGLYVGFAVYSSAMFHKFTPTWSDIATVANCGIPTNVQDGVGDKTRPTNGGAYFCRIAPGEWIRTPYGTGPICLAIGIILISALAAIRRSTFLRWATRSFAGVVTLFLLLFGVPMMLLGLQFDFITGTLTLDVALRTAILAALAGSIMGLFAWLILSQRLGKHSPGDRAER
jgi:hypothetical protein